MSGAPNRAGARGLERRSRLITVLLLLTVGLTSVLTYQAQDAARSHRATAERALRSYSSIAAWNLYKSGQELLFVQLAGSMDTLRRSLPANVEALRARARQGHGEGCACLGGTGDRVRFALVGPRHDLVSDEPLPPAVRTWIHDSLPNRAGATVNRSLAVGVAFPPGGARAVSYAVNTRASGGGPPIFGYVEPVDHVGATFKGILRVFPLLPEVLLQGSPNESLLSADVRAPSGLAVYSSARTYPSTFSASATLPAFFGGLHLRVALSPGAAERLVIGGLPHSRLPLLLGVLALTIALVVVAVQLLRREAELARMREDFLSSVSHELRTPLAQIRMFAETLLLGRTRSEAERRRSLEIIDQEARRLSRLVENVLRMSRAARGVSQLAPEAVPMTAEVASIVEGFRLFAAQRRAELRAELQPDVVAVVDCGGLHQMVLNLLDNAVKYGPAGQRVVIGLAVFGDVARLWVDDEGPGIPEDEREKVFSPFYRSPRDAGSAVAGSGIGLAVVREIAVSHGGRAWIEDAPAGGARVTLEIPGAFVRPPATQDEGVAA